MYDRRVAALLNEDDSLQDEILWKEMNAGGRHAYPRLLFVITGNAFLATACFRYIWLLKKQWN